jgi:hypothetical protein
MEIALSPGRAGTARKSTDLWTGSKPDVVWSVRTGPGLRAIVDYLTTENPGLRSIHQTFGPVPEFLPVATFEIESNAETKHARGAVLSLASRPGLGLFIAVTGDPMPTLRAYRPVLGAGNVVGVSASALLGAWQ